MQSLGFGDMLCAMDPLNRCRMCGSTAYKRVISRDARGAMSASGVYQCTGCRLLFTQLDDWRVSPVEQALVHSAAQYEHSRGDSMASRV
jgi:hypothetical protein